MLAQVGAIKLQPYRNGNASKALLTRDTVLMLGLWSIMTHVQYMSLASKPTCHDGLLYQRCCHRCFRLARKWKSLNRIVTTLLHSVVSVGWLSTLLLLFMFMMSLLGMQVCVLGPRYLACVWHVPVLLHTTI